MFKSIFSYLLRDNPETKHQLIGVRFLVIFAVLVLLAPLAYHQFIPRGNIVSQSEIDSLKLCYINKLDSIDKIQVKKVDCSITSDVQREQSKKEKSVSYKSIPKVYSRNKPEEKSFPKFNLNSATVQQLRYINGIGEILAKRIIKYRTKLGGFYDKEQLREVYGLEPDVVKKLYRQLDNSVLKPISFVNLNTGTFKEVLSHPYLEYKDVQVIFNNRPINEKSKFCDLLPEKCDKLEVYLDFSE